jgi:hypothetical protein
LHPSLKGNVEAVREPPLRHPFLTKDIERGARGCSLPLRPALFGRHAPKVGDDGLSLFVSQAEGHSPDALRLA